MKIHLLSGLLGIISEYGLLKMFIREEKYYYLSMVYTYLLCFHSSIILFYSNWLLLNRIIYIIFSTFFIQYSVLNISTKKDNKEISKINRMIFVIIYTFTIPLTSKLILEGSNLSYLYLKKLFS